MLVNRRHDSRDSTRPPCSRAHRRRRRWVAGRLGTGSRRRSRHAEGTGDNDGDGVSDAQEYLADTDPLTAGNTLRITSYSVTAPGGADDDNVTWTSRPTRLYRVQYKTDLNPAFSWLQATSLSSPDRGATTTRTVHFDTPSLHRFFRIEAVKPLSP